ncbi:probable RNA-binding protein 18 isoform X1 [Musca domestica]|nr:probable RNA-binding protein 18 isoform X1 [Musca domestica]
MASTSTASTTDDRRIWVGNLDPRLSEFHLLKVMQKCGEIEKFDMLFHKGGPLQGQSRGYAFVTFTKSSSAMVALEKLNGHVILNRPIAVRLAKNINYDEFERPKPKIEIPALGTGKREGKITREEAIKAIEQKLKAIESQGDDIDFSQPTAGPVIPLIQKYQFNKDRDAKTATTTQRRPYHKTSSGPYSRHQRPKRR